MRDFKYQQTHKSAKNVHDLQNLIGDGIVQIVSMSKTITVQNLNTSEIFTTGLTDGNVSVEIITMRPHLNMDLKKYQLP